jgi:hypothetical protein
MTLHTEHWSRIFNEYIDTYAKSVGTTFLQIVTVNDDNKRLTLCHPSFQVKHALVESFELCSRLSRLPRSGCWCPDPKRWMESITMCSRRDLLLENLPLRQQLMTLKQKHRRPRVAVADKLFWVLLAALLA